MPAIGSPYPAPCCLIDVAIADVNGDGLNDALQLDLELSTIVVLLNRPSF